MQTSVLVHHAGPEEEQQAMKDANVAGPPPPTSVKLGDFIPKPLE